VLFDEENKWKEHSQLVVEGNSRQSVEEYLWNNCGINVEYQLEYQVAKPSTILFPHSSVQAKTQYLQVIQLQMSYCTFLDGLIIR